MSDVLTTIEPFLTASPADFAADDALRADATAAFEAFLTAMEAGTIRAAAPGPEGWTVEPRVKQGILVGFRLGQLEDMSGPALSFVDKHTYPARRFTPADGVRVVPGGSSVRRGAYLAPGVTMMPPAYVNVGAYVDTGTMVDSHALVGSCAQIGKRVHLSAAAQIGGVLEPIGALPVIIGDDVLVGGGVGVFEGVRVANGAVLAAGVTLTSSSRIIDLVGERFITAGDDGVLVVPEGAVVVPGTRPASGDFAAAHGVQLSAPVIVKMRDDKTDAKAALEEALRG